LGGVVGVEIADDQRVVGVGFVLKGGLEDVTRREDILATIVGRA